MSELTFDLQDSKVIELSKELILSKVKEEAIWSFYGVPITKGLFCSKLRNDKNPTCSLYRNRTGRIVMKDFGTGWTGDCFAYVSELFNSDFQETLGIVANDFGIINTKFVKNKAKIEYNGEVCEEKSATIIQVEIRDFQKYELKWWSKFGITENTLKKFRVFSCKNVWLNGNLFHTEKENQLVFGYYGGIKNGIEQWRIYMPERRSKKYKFISNWKSTQIQGAKMLPKNGGDLLVITKSLKDVMVLYEFGIPAIAPCSENTFVTSKQYDKLRNKFKVGVVFFDNDKPGIVAMQQLKKKYPELKFTWLPRNTEKDISDFYKKFGKRKTKELIEKAKQMLCLEKQIDVEETITNFK